MITEHCELMSLGACAQDRVRPVLAGKRSISCATRKASPFLLRAIRMGGDIYFNAIELDVVHAIPEFIEAGVSRFVVDATLLSAEDAAFRVARLRDACMNREFASEKRANTDDRPSVPRYSVDTRQVSGGILSGT